MSTGTTTLSTRNQLYTEYDYSKIFIFDNDFQNMTLLEGASAETTFEAGTLLGRITSGGKVIPLASGATDGSQLPVGILAETITLAADAEASVRVCIKGELPVGKIGFDGTDDLETVVSARTLGDRLHDLGIYPKNVDELSESDNS